MQLTLSSVQCSRTTSPAASRKLTPTVSSLRREAREAGLSEEERRENVIGTFKVVDSRSMRGRTILLVDDVMATGATLSECAKILKEGGVWRVWGLTLARSVLQK